MTVTFWIRATQLILCLSLLVVLHELGHFLFARLFRVRVEKFYMFFDWKFSIVRFKKIKGKWRVKFFAPSLPDHVMPLTDENGATKLDRKGKPIMVPAPLEDLSDDDWRKYPETTEWGIGWIPLGGYCKICGMVDESMDLAQMKRAPQPWEYRSRPIWQRMFIITGGVLMNFLSAIVIYAMILFAWGKETIPMTSAYLGYDYCHTALDCGFVNGDRIVKVDGEDICFEKEALEKIVIEGKTNVTVHRNGKDTLLILPQDFGERMLEAEEKGFMTERFPFVIEESVGANSNLQRGDSVVAINGEHLATYSEIVSKLAEHKGDSISMTIVREGYELTERVWLDSEGKIGVMLKNPAPYFKTIKEEYGFFASFPAGWKLGVETLKSYVKQFRLVFTKAGAKSLGGFGAIGSLFPATWDWQMFWSMTAFISIILAFMNILPIPVLDGGYLLFLVYEMITRRKPSEKFMEVALNIGMLLLLALLIFANGNDIFKLFK